MQDAGRGRQGRNWASAAGNFFGSTLVDLRAGDPPPQTLALAAGLALIDAVELVAPERPLMLKWPNDLLIEGAKLAGILLERNEQRVVAGFGVNLAVAPALQDRAAASLEGAILPEAFAPILAGAFARRLQSWREELPEVLPEAWLARAHPAGTPLTVHGGGGERLSGEFAGIELDGALRLLRQDGTIETVRAGDVQL